MMCVSAYVRRGGGVSREGTLTVLKSMVMSQSS
jgi:hypothetical protein